MPKPIHYVYRSIGISGLQVWRDESGDWYYDGPANCGPRHVRTSGNGPCWRGPISSYFAEELRRRLKKAGYSPDA